MKHSGWAGPVAATLLHDPPTSTGVCAIAQSTLPIIVPSGMAMMYVGDEHGLDVRIAEHENNTLTINLSPERPVATTLHLRRHVYGQSRD